MSKEKSTAKSDQMRAAREAQFKAREAASAERAAAEEARAKEVAKAARVIKKQNRIAEILDPSILREKLSDDSADRRVAERAARALRPPTTPQMLSTEEGRCRGCGKIRAVRNGRVIGHSVNGAVCAGARQKPKRAA